MSFILVPNRGEDVKVNAWNWRPTLVLLRRANLINEETHERLGIHGGGGHVDAHTCGRITDFLEGRLKSMQPGQRIRADLTVADKPKKQIVFTPGMKTDDIDGNELYSATYEWLVMFKDFCKISEGFKVS